MRAQKILTHLYAEADLAAMPPDVRAGALGHAGRPVCEAGARTARDEAGHWLARGDLDEALVWIERIHPGFHGLARAVARTGLRFGPATARRGEMYERAAAALCGGDVAEAIALIAGSSDRLDRLPHLLNARAGA